MKITLIAQSEADFQEWAQEMTAGSKTVPDSGDAVADKSGE
jgi:hypothetical protein